MGGAFPQNAHLISSIVLIFFELWGLINTRQLMTYVFLDLSQRTDAIMQWSCGFPNLLSDPTGTWNQLFTVIAHEMCKAKTDFKTDLKNMFKYEVHEFKKSALQVSNPQVLEQTYPSTRWF